MKTSEFFKKIKNGEAKALTVDIATQMIGKTIHYMYFGYPANKIAVKKCTISEIISEADFVHRTEPERFNSWTPDMKKSASRHLVIISNGENTFIRYNIDFNYFDEPTFTCSDGDREVYFCQ